ncbi:tyrosine-type recombinase/integrase [Curtobacterium sp. VKM Ac-2861]|uniref:tyrosine-type recombinase/integrase n=1 Tax=Curtobacterium sp. VKM Ac-2861 TaxID=2739016 RepID=UPI001563C14F|nr:tyrosine-type recombinase/integrase [Curtobacterium sp. VKM Ac-2861]
MGRQKLPTGQHGSISTTEVAAVRGHDGQLVQKKYVVAKTRLGVAAGPSRLVEARGATAGAARRALQAKLATLRAELEQNPTEPSGPTMAELVEKWWAMKTAGRLAENTRLAYRDVIDRLILPKLGETPVRDVRADVLASWLHEERQIRRVQAEHARTLLNQMLNAAVAWQWRDSNPVRDVKPLSNEQPETDPRGDEERWLGSADLEALREGLHGMRQRSFVPDMVELMLGLGLRISEAIALRAGDIEWEHPDGVLVHVRRAVITPAYGQPFLQAHTKSGPDGARAVFAAAFVVEILRRLASAAASEGFLLVNRDGGMVSARSARTSLRMVRERVGLLRVTAHTFRRTAGRAAADEGGVAAATALLGHASEATTEEFYLPKMRKAPADARAALQALAPSQTPTD